MKPEILLFILASCCAVSTHAQATPEYHNHETDSVKAGKSYVNNIRVPVPATTVLAVTAHSAPAAVVKKEYVEKWEIQSARTTTPGSVEKDYLLSPAAYFKFLDYKTVVFRLNDGFPEQVGEFIQSPLAISITALPDAACSGCVTDLIISRNAISDKEFQLSFNNRTQFFTVKSFR